MLNCSAMKSIEPETNKQNEQTKINPAALLSAWCGEIQCFSELESRIAALPTEQLRGRVFRFSFITTPSASTAIW